MKSVFTAVVCLSAAFVASGCAIVRSPVMGGIYTDVKSPQSANNAGLGAKMGESCATSILGLVATGDASVTTAAKIGGIKTVTHVDEYATSVLGIYAKYCARVYGN